MKLLYATHFRYGIVILLISFNLFFSFNLLAQSFPTGFQTNRLAQNLNPTDMKFSPDGQFLFVTDKSGKIFLSHNDSWNATPIIDFSAQVDPFNERGFNHLAVDPDFATNGFIYVYYTVKNMGYNRIARFTFNLTTHIIDPASQLTLLDLDVMQGTIHTGGALNFGADGKLYITTGESSNGFYSQRMDMLLGKVLRMNKDGSIPTDNPFYNTASGKYRLIYALGLRNPFTADVQPGTGRYFVCDVGEALFEEINEISAGKNYGWSLIEGPRPANIPAPPNYADPFYPIHHDSACAIIGGVFYNPPVNGFPAAYTGKFFYGDYCVQKIRIMDPVTKTHFSTFATNVGRPVTFAISPSNGAFYYLDRGGTPWQGSEEDNTSSDEGALWKVVYTGSLAPTIAVHPDTITTSVGQNVTFGVVANGQNLSYQWQRNGTDIPGATLSTFSLTNVQASDSGALFRVRVSNPQGSITSNIGLLSVSSRPPPQPVITLPAEGFTYVANTTLNFSGSATDAVDGNIPASKLTWKVDFHHDEHTHPVLPVTPGISSGSFFISPSHDISHNVWYRIYLTAENSLGLKTTVQREVFPQKVKLYFEGTPGIFINVDGTQFQLPDSILSVKGMIRSITAPATFMVGDTLFNFVQWGNGSTNNQLSFSTPMADSAITAVYTKKAVWNGTGLNGQYYNLDETQNFNGTPVLERTDPVIDFTWAGSPGGTVRADQFSVRWTGFVQPRTSGAYTFFANTNDGVRLYVNNELIIDEWHSQSTFETQGTINLEAGVKYAIRLEFFDSFGEAVAQLRWSGPDIAKQLIPTNAMFATEGAPLPVNFVQFTVKPTGDALQLNWKVEDLGNVKDYTVERRKPGSGSYEAIATIPHTGMLAYSYTDRSVTRNIVYEYRIKQTDLDGRFLYSKARSGMLSSNVGFDFVIVPNPTGFQRQIQLVFTQEIARCRVQVINAAGQIKIDRTMQATAGQSLEISLQGLSSGTYYIRLIDNDKVVTKKLLIQ